MATNFHNFAPEFKFVGRQNVVLSIDVQKTTEESPFKAITQAMHVIEPLGFSLTDYTSYSDTSFIPGHYVLFGSFKLREMAAYLNLIKVKWSNVVEHSRDEMYRKLRNWSILSPLEIRVVKEGKFIELMDFILSRGTSSVSHYKTPKRIKSEEAIQILDSGVVGKFSSEVLSRLNA